MTGWRAIGDAERMIYKGKVATTSTRAGRAADGPITGRHNDSRLQAQ